MKNLIIALSLFFAVGAAAQSTKKPTEKKIALKSVQYIPSTPEEGGLKNITALENFIPLKSDTRAMLLELFTTKYRMLNEVSDMSAERKSIVSQSIASKLENSIDAATFAKIKANKVLFASLVN